MMQGWVLIGGAILGMFVTLLAQQATQSLQAKRQPTKKPEIIIGSSQLYKVVNVVDGDTIDVEMAGQPTRIRLIGVDTPELADPRRQTECLAVEASQFTSNILEEQYVRLEIDSTHPAHDDFDRILAYVFLPDGRNFNQLLLQDGWAYEYSFEEKPYHYQDQFQAAERQAKRADQGIWSQDCLR